MNSRQRLLTALSNEQPDKVPIWEGQIDEPVLVSIGQILGVREGLHSSEQVTLWGEQKSDVLDLYCLVVQELGLDGTLYGLSTGLEPVGDDYVRDRYGRVYRLSKWGEPTIVEGPIREASDITGYDMAIRLKPDDFSRMEYILDRVGPEKAHIILLHDPFKVGWSLRGGMENLLVDIVVNPGLVHDLMRIATDFNLAAVSMAADIGVDGFLLAGDFAGESKLFMSPRHFREHFKPYHNEIVEHVHEHGLKIIKHSDGNVWPILDDFLEVGFDGFHPIQPQCMDIARVKEHVSGNLCLLGNIDCRDLLCFDTEENVVKAVKETIEKAAPGGGYIICSSNSIHPGVKPENYIAMIRAAHKYGVYPSEVP